MNARLQRTSVPGEDSRDGRLYLTIADDMAGLIVGGRWRSGDRVPSVRVLAQQRRISATTALAALRTLERRGLVEARPKSGYFVRQRSRTAAEVQPSRPPRQPHEVAIDGRLGAIISASLAPGTVELGSALPDPRWFPTGALQQLLARAARRQPQMLGEYGPFMGLASLREALARRYSAVGCSLEPDELVITNGCMEALSVALAAVATAGDVIAIESPAYFGFLQLLEGMGLRALEIATDARAGLSLEALGAALDAPGNERIKACLLTSSFSNPLGATLPESRKRELLALCRKRRIALIEDDVYGELTHSGHRPPPIKSFDTDGHVILCSSFSKVLAPGARVGWIAAGRWSEKIRLRRIMASIATPAVLQATLTEYLASGRYERHLHRVRASCADHVAWVSDAVERYFPQGTRLGRPEGGFILWVELPSGRDTFDLWERARAERISFLPGPLFSATGRYRSCMRLNCGQPWNRRTERALATLGRLASE